MEKDLRILRGQCLNIIKDEMMHINKKTVSENKEELLKKTEELYAFLKEKGFIDKI